MKYSKYSILVLMVLLSGCHFLDSNNSPLPETGIAEDGLTFRFVEFQRNHEDPELELFLELRTNKIYECTNYKIGYQKLKSSTFIDIRLTSVSLGPICLTAFGPATAFIPFSDIEGERNLFISDGEISDLHEIEVTHESVTVTSIISSFSEPTETRYNRKSE